MVTLAALEPDTVLPCVVGLLPRSALSPSPPVTAKVGPLLVMMRVPLLSVTEHRLIWLFETSARDGLNDTAFEARVPVAPLAAVFTRVKLWPLTLPEEVMPMGIGVEAVALTYDEASSMVVE